MSKMISVLLAIVLCCAGIGFAPAAGGEAEENGNTLVFNNGGIVLTLPGTMEDLKGSVQCYPGAEVADGSGVYAGSLQYVAKTPEDLLAMENEFLKYEGKSMDELSEEEQQSLYGIMTDVMASTKLLCQFVTISSGRTLEDVAAYFGDGLKQYRQTLLGTVGEYSHYLLWPQTDSDEYQPDTVPENLRDEYIALMSDPDQVVRNIALGEPAADALPDYTGMDFSSLEAKDLDGQPADLKEIFAQHEVTMVNCWATFCGPCKEEFPELEKMSREMAEKGGAIIGICIDIKGDNTEKARKILADCGVTYPNFFVGHDAEINQYLTVVPTSFFVNREGKVVAAPVEGAYLEEYRNQFEKNLHSAE